MTAAARSNVTPIRPLEVSGPVYLSPAQVCELVPGMTVENLKELRSSGKGPRFSKPTGERGHVTLYRRDDVVAWVESAFVGTRDQA